MEMPGGQFYGLAGTDQQGRVSAEIGEHLSRHAHGSEGDGDSAGADIGVRAYLLGNRESLLEEAVQHRTRGPCLLCRPIGILHLAENLRFPEDGRIQSAGNGECMRDRAVVVEGIEALVHGPRQTMIIHEPFPGLPDASVQVVAVELCAVARGNNDHLLDLGEGHQMSQGFTELVRVEGNLLPKLDWCRTVIDSEYFEWHSQDIGHRRFAQLSTIGRGHTRSSPYRPVARYGILNSSLPLSPL